MINEEDDADKEGVLWLGTENESDLIIDRDGQCGTGPKFQEDGTVLLKNPTDFDTAFLAYVRSQSAELTDEFGDIGLDD